MEIKCKHIDGKEDSTYIYEINSEQDLMLCKQCNLNLAGEIAKQQAIETFV